MNDWVVETPLFEEDLMNNRVIMLNQKGVNRVVEIIKYKDKEIEDLKEQVEYQDLWRNEYLSRIDKAIEFVERKQEDINNGGNDMSYIQMTQLLEILKGSDKQ